MKTAVTKSISVIFYILSIIIGIYELAEPCNNHCLLKGIVFIGYGALSMFFFVMEILQKRE
jgi:hypothetical protein